MRQDFNRNQVKNALVTANVTRIYNQLFENFDAKMVLMITALSLRHLRDHNSFFETYLESSPYRHTIHTILPYGYPPAAGSDADLLHDEIDANILRDITADCSGMTQGMIEYYRASYNEHDPYQKAHDGLFRDALALLNPCNAALNMACEMTQTKNRLTRSYIFDPVVYGLMLQPLLQRQKEFWEGRITDIGATQPQRENFRHAARYLDDFLKDVREFNHAFLPSHLPPAPSHDALAERLENLFRHFCDFGRRFDALEFEYHAIFKHNGTATVFDIFKAYMNMAFGDLGNKKSHVRFINNVRAGEFSDTAKP